MKKVLAGGFLTLMGSVSFLAITVVCVNNLVTTWDTGLGRFWSTVSEMHLMVLSVLCAMFAVLGLVLMAVGLFRREK